MTIAEKTAYLKGLYEGLGYNRDKDDGKLFGAIIGTLGDIAEALSEHEEMIDELGEELAGKATVAKVNVDDNKAIASQFRVMSIPTVIFFVDGVEKERLIGVQPKQKYIDTLNSL